MKYLYIASAVLATSFVNAQGSLPAVPSCSLQCFTTALTSDGCSSITDFQCHCSKPQLVSTIEPCVAAACSPADQATVQSVVEQTCASVGEPLSLSGAPGGSTSSPASSTAAAVSASVASTSISSATSSVISLPPAASGPPIVTSAVSTPVLPTSTTTATSSVLSLPPAASGPPIVTPSKSSGVASPTSGGVNATTSIVPFTGAATQGKGPLAAGVLALVLAAACYVL